MNNYSGIMMAAWISILAAIIRSTEPRFKHLNSALIVLSLIVGFMEVGEQESGFRNKFAQLFRVVLFIVLVVYGFLIFMNPFEYVR